MTDSVGQRIGNSRQIKVLARGTVSEHFARTLAAPNEIAYVAEVNPSEVDFERVRKYVQSFKGTNGYVGEKAAQIRVALMMDDAMSLTVVGKVNGDPNGTPKDVMISHITEMGETISKYLTTKPGSGTELIRL